MFENAIGLDQVTDDLRRAIESRVLPQAILLSGPRYGGKSTVALEVARALACHGDRRWDCRCRSCVLHRTLSHPGLILAGPRYFELETEAAFAAYHEEPRLGTLFLLVRSIRKVLRRFDEELWTEARIRKIQPSLESVESLLQDLEPAADAREIPQAARDTAALKKLNAAVERLLKAVPHEIVPVDLVRAVASWAHISSTAGPKVIIIEEVHTLQESARNSMLKLLEEPPTDVYLVLTTTRRSAVIPTLLSRLRTYQFPERSAEDQRRVQENIFRRKSPGTQWLSEFFRSAREDVDKSRQELADRVVSCVLDRTPAGDLLDELRAETPRGGSSIQQEFFFEELTEAVRRRLPEATPAQARRMQEWGPLFHAYRGRIENRNMNPAATIAGMVLALHRTGER